MEKAGDSGKQKFCEHIFILFSKEAGLVNLEGQGAQVDREGGGTRGGEEAGRIGSSSRGAHPIPSISNLSAPLISNRHHHRGDVCLERAIGDSRASAININILNLSLFAFGQV